MLLSSRFVLNKGSRKGGKLEVPSQYSRSGETGTIGLMTSGDADLVIQLSRTIEEIIFTRA